MRATGYIPDASSSADYINADEVIAKYSVSQNLSSADMSSLVAEVLDQGLGLSSCVANAAAQALRMVAWRDSRELPPPPLPARMEPYALARLQHDAKLSDSGTNFSAYFSALDKFGITAETSYSAADVNRRPSPLYMHRAFDQRSKRLPLDFAPYYRLFGPARAWPEKVKALLVREVVVVGGFSVDERFVDNQIDPDEPLRRLGEVGVGGPSHHAMVITGFSGDKFRVLNSWGPSFGDGGYCWLHADYLSTAVTTDALWAIESAPRLD